MPEACFAISLRALRGARVLEVACGIGYWTAFVAPVAETVVATDLAPAVLALAFLRQLHTRVGIGATVVAFDNRYVEGSSTRISRTDADGNTYQLRRLADSTEYEVLKNFPSLGEIEAFATDAGGVAVEVLELDYYWWLTYRVGSAGRMR